ncbi:MAG: endonuclease III domain-containing protein [Candidatus Methylomirabilales bacterium]
MRRRLMQLYHLMFHHFGPRGWWPGRGPFEVIVGAILTQNTAWRNVAKAISNLRATRVLSPARLRALPRERLEEQIRPAGYFRVKAKRLRHFLTWLENRHGGNVTRMFRQDSAGLRRELLAISGIGPETADSILLYAGGHAWFVVDAYTKRILIRHGLLQPDATYAETQTLFMGHLPQDVQLYNEYHALLVAVGKTYCRPRDPRCTECPLMPDLKAHGLTAPLPLDSAHPARGRGVRRRRGPAP